MNRRTSITLIAALLSFSVFLSVEAFAQQGTAQEAQAMLTKAVAAVKADKTKAIDMFVKGEGGFLVGDLYPFCFETSDGKILATQAKQFIGTDVRNLKDGTGKPFGMDLYAAAKEGKITQLHVSEAGHRQDAGSKGKLRDGGWRSRLRCRLLQVDRGGQGRGR